MLLVVSFAVWLWNDTDWYVAFQTAHEMIDNDENSPGNYEMIQYSINL